MPLDTTSPAEPDAEDLKTSLCRELGNQFSTRLSTDATMPDAAKAALVSLLAKSATIPADILKALETEDLEQKEADGE